MGKKQRKRLSLEEEDRLVRTYFLKDIFKTFVVSIVVFLFQAALFFFLNK